MNCMYNVTLNFKYGLEGTLFLVLGNCLCFGLFGQDYDWTFMQKQNTTML